VITAFPVGREKSLLRKRTFKCRLLPVSKIKQLPVAQVTAAKSPGGGLRGQVDTVLLPEGLNALKHVAKLADL
jgi:hypothetical protein